MKNIIIWGTGKKALELCNNIIDCNILSFIESNPQKKEFKGKTVLAPNDIQNIDFNILIISLLHPMDVWKTVSNNSDINYKSLCVYMEDFMNVIDIINNYKRLSEACFLFKKEYFLQLVGPYRDIVPHLIEFEENNSAFDI